MRGVEDHTSDNCFTQRWLFDPTIFIFLNICLPQVGSIGRLSLADIERLAVFSLGRTLSSAAANGLRSVQPLLTAMCSEQLAVVPRLLDVLSEVERHWRQEVEWTEI